MGTYEVRGVWFVTARAEVEHRFGPEALEVLVESVPAAHRAAIARPSAEVWYPERSLQACLHSLRLQLAGGHPVRFGELLERCTERGMGLVFSTLVRLTTPRFLLSQVPMMWDHIRRGPGFVTVGHDARGTTLSYRNFPFFDDPIYEQLTVSSVRAILRLSAGFDPPISVERVSADELDLHVPHAP